MNKKLQNLLALFWLSIRYNLKILFANKFLYFLLAAVAIFLLVTVINILDANANPSPSGIYYLLLVPGLLLIFYPTAFGIQNDSDYRMLEVLFGIPNYRYKVWLVRLLIIYTAIFFMLFVLALLSSLAMVSFPLLQMVYQVMFPIFFIGSLSFMFSTLVRNGYGTGIVMTIIGLIFWIASEPLSESKFNLFLNPFRVPERVSEIVWADIVFNNRIYLLVGMICAILYGFLNLQKRERFI